MSNIKRHWWKALAAILILYSLIVGMTAPLRPGVVTDKTSLSIAVGQTNTLSVNFYNARFLKEPEGTIVARLRLTQDSAICAEQVKVVDDRNLEIQFAKISDINPKLLKSPYPLLEFGSPVNGYTVSSVYIRSDTSNIQDSIIIENKFCAPSALPVMHGVNFPFLNILEETIRNLFYHVPMWFGMMLILVISMVFSILQLRNPDNIRNDLGAKAFAGVGVLYGVLGIITGAIWAKHTWGAYWTWDIKQNTSAIALLIYMAYFVLRSSFDDADKRARISAAYNIFAFATLIPLLYIIPRMKDSLHPGAEGNPAFSSYDLDNTLRLVFYPSVLGWILLGIWIAQLWMRIDRIWQKKMELHE
jgi:heme exporter protein C